MNFVCFIFIVFLFVILTPSNFVRLPQKGNKWVVSLLHGILFAAILCFTYRYFMSFGSIVEGQAQIDANGYDLSTYKNKCNVKCNNGYGNDDQCRYYHTEHLGCYKQKCNIKCDGNKYSSDCLPGSKLNTITLKNEKVTCFA